MERNDRMLFGIASFASGFSLAISINCLFLNDASGTFFYLMLAWIYGFLGYLIGRR